MDLRKEVQKQCGITIPSNITEEKDLLLWANLQGCSYAKLGDVRLALSTKSPSKLNYEDWIRMQKALAQEISSDTYSVCDITSPFESAPTTQGSISSALRP